MVWCDSCKADVEVDHNDAGGFTCCYHCGRVLEDIAFSSDVQFAKGADGEGEMVGQFVGESGQPRGLARMANGRMWGVRGDSHEVAINKGRQEISAMIDHFVIRPREDSLEAAHRLYKLAVQRGFTKGRRVAHVAAACLYIICRQETKPFMLIDYSDLLQVNVYVLGSVYLQLLKLLRLEEHPSFTRPIDPSLYIHRFTERLFERNKATPIADTALHLISSMKRDWMQTGRRPSGVCGAALFIAAHIHGLETTKRDIIGVVHVGNHTLDKRVREFATTTAAALTVAEFDEQAEELELETQRLLEEKAKEASTAAAALPAPGDPSSSGKELVVAQPIRAREAACEHMALGERHFAHGMCRRCFEAFLSTSGGIWSEGASDPPAFARAAKAALAAAGPETDGMDPQEAEEQRELLQLEAEMAEAMVRLRTAGLSDGIRDEQGSAEFGKSVLEYGRGMIVARMPDGAAATAGTGKGKGTKRARTKASERAAAATKGGSGSNGSAAAGGADAGEGAAIPAKRRAVAAASGTESPVAQPSSPNSSQQPSRRPEQQQVPAGNAHQQATQHPATPDAAESPLPSPASPGKTRMRPNIPTRPRPARRLPGDEPSSQGGEAADDQQEQQEQQQQEGQQQEEGDGQQDQDMADGATGMEIEAVDLADGQLAEQQREEEEEEEEQDTLSDLDDDELNEYIHTKNEARIKTVYWTHMNKDWLEKQEAKQAALAAVAEEATAAAAANSTSAPDTHNDATADEDGMVIDALGAAAEAAGAAGGAKSKGKRPGPKKGSKHKKVAPLPEARSAAHAAQMMLDKKHLSDKVNYAALDDLFAPPTAAAKEADAAAAAPGYGASGGLFSTGKAPAGQGQRTSNSRLGMGGLISSAAGKRTGGPGAVRPGGLGGSGFADVLLSRGNGRRVGGL